MHKKDRKVLQPIALSKSDEPKKVSGPIDDLSKEEQKPKKAYRKKAAAKAGKNSTKVTSTY